MEPTELTATTGSSGLFTSLGLPSTTNSVNSIVAQDLSPQFSWRSSDIRFVRADSIAGNDDNTASGIAIDGANNVYITGQFKGTVDFDPGAGVFNLTSAGLSDGFVAKLNANGSLAWAKSFGGTTTSAISVDTAGNVYTIGSFTGTVDFDPGLDTFNLTSAADSSPFISKINADGSFAWAKSIAGSDTTINSIAVDSADRVYITGAFSSSVVFSPGLNAFTLTTAGQRDGFVAKLSTDGNFIWTKGIGGDQNDVASSIAVDRAGNAYVIGSFSGTANFGSSTDTTLTAVGNRNTFVTKLNADGSFNWARNWGGSGSNQGIDVAVDRAGNVYTAAGFSGTIDLDPGASTFNVTSTNGGANTNGLITKLNAEGNFVWAKTLAGSNVQITDLAVDSTDNLYTVGLFSGTIGLGGVTLTSSNNSEFMTQLNASSSGGDFAWAKTLGGSGTVSSAAIAVDSAGSVYTAGSFKGTIDVDPGPGSTTLTSVSNSLSSSSNSFVVKLSPQNTTGSGTLVSTILGSAAINPATGLTRSIAITAADSANGTWQYSVNGGISWSAFEALSESSPLLLVASSTTQIRFVPNYGYEGTAEIRFAASDARPLARSRAYPDRV